MPAPKHQISFGIQAVAETIKAGKEIEKLLIQNGINNPSIKELILLARKHHIPVTKVPAQKLNQITFKNHQGVVCFISPIRYASLDHLITQAFQDGRSPFLIILDRITDVRNFGGIARTAESAKVDALVIPDKGSALISGDAMKTSAGALNFIPVCRSQDLGKTVNYLKESGINVIACTEKASGTIFDLDLVGPVAIILGSEEDGISDEYLRKADYLAKIPLFGEIESLNVSAAAAITIFEVVRQRVS